MTQGKLFLGLLMHPLGLGSPSSMFTDFQSSLFPSSSLRGLQYQPKDRLYYRESDSAQALGQSNGYLL